MTSQKAVLCAFACFLYLRRDKEREHKGSFVDFLILCTNLMHSLKVWALTDPCTMFVFWPAVHTHLWLAVWSAVLCLRGPYEVLTCLKWFLFRHNGCLVLLVEDSPWKSFSHLNSVTNFIMVLASHYHPFWSLPCTKDPCSLEGEFLKFVLFVFCRVWWTFFVVLFYVLSPLPTLIARRYTESTGSSSTTAYELAMFITMGFVVSSFALPIVLARSPESAPVVSLALWNYPSFCCKTCDHSILL